MKLLVCYRCKDVRALQVMERTICRCGSMWGQYMRNEMDAAFGGDGGLLGFSSSELGDAIYQQLKEGDLLSGLGRTFTAWVMPDGADTAHRLDPQEEAQARAAGRL